MLSSAEVEGLYTSDFAELELEDVDDDVLDFVAELSELTDLEVLGEQFTSIPKRNATLVKNKIDLIVKYYDAKLTTTFLNLL